MPRSSAICNVCKAIPLNIFIEPNFEYLLRSSYQELRTSARNGCALCKLFLKTLRLKGSMNHMENESVRLQYCDPHNVTPTNIRCGSVEGLVSVVMSQGEKNKEIKWGEKTYLPLTPDSELSLDLMKSLIVDCLENHPYCGHGQRDLPTRLLYLGSDGRNPQIRLVPGSHCSWSGGRYLCLSHCWGNDHQGAAWELRKSRVDTYSENIPTSLLPKTYRQAIDLTLVLGERYLWIDSLCIIQDSQADWYKEASSMAQIYMGALCTLSSASAGPTQGCIVERDADSVSPIELELFTLGASRSAMVTFYPTIPEDAELEKNLPVYKRAWCLQERELARSLIQFTPYQFIWNCATLNTSERALVANLALESGPQDIGKAGPLTSNPSLQVCDLWMFPRRTPSLTTPEVFGSWWDLISDENAYHIYYSYWLRTMERYSSCAITRPIDRLPALEGLANRQQEHCEDQYVAGIWEGDLISGLLWKSESDIASRPEPPIAPSWSWVSVNSRIKFCRQPLSLPLNWPQAHNFALSSICAVDIPNFQEVLRVKGILLEAKVSQSVWNPRVGLNESYLEPANGSFWGVLTSLFEKPGTVRFDTRADFHNDTTVFCLIMDWDLGYEDTSSGDCYLGSGRGIAVRKMPDTDNIYTRVGHVIWNDMNSFIPLKEEQSEFAIM